VSIGVDIGPGDEKSRLSRRLLSRLSAAARRSLSGGDLGAALLAAACIGGDARFPGIDDL
jgi:hypothetical protein